MAWCGTLCLPKKSEAASVRVTPSKYINRVLLLRDDLQQTPTLFSHAPCLVDMPTASTPLHLKRAQPAPCGGFQIWRGKRDESCFWWGEGGGGLPSLIEANVATSTKPQELQVNAPSLLNGCLVLLTHPEAAT